MRNLTFILLLILSTASFANYDANVSSEGWVAEDGKPVPDTNNMKSNKGFGGWLIITPDKDWAKKWETPSDSTPYFSEAKTVEYGQQLTILTFYINPLKDKDKNVNIVCSIKIIRPDKTISIDDQGRCVTGHFTGKPGSVYLSPIVIEYSGDDGDLPGEWLVEVVLTDKNRNASVKLFSKFTLIKKVK